MDYEKAIILSDGIHTFAFVDGKIYGDRITDFKYEHRSLENPKIEIKADGKPIGRDDDAALTGFIMLLNEMLYGKE